MVELVQFTYLESVEDRGGISTERKLFGPEFVHPAYRLLAPLAPLRDVPEQPKISQRSNAEKEEIVGLIQVNAPCAWLWSNAKIGVSSGCLEDTLCDGGSSPENRLGTREVNVVDRSDDVLAIEMVAHDGPLAEIPRGKHKNAR